MCLWPRGGKKRDASSHTSVLKGISRAGREKLPRAARIYPPKFHTARWPQQGREKRFRPEPQAPPLLEAGKSTRRERCLFAVDPKRLFSPSQDIDQKKRYICLFWVRAVQRKKYEIMVLADGRVTSSIRPWEWRQVALACARGGSITCGTHTRHEKRKMSAQATKAKYERA